MPESWTKTFGPCRRCGTIAVQLQIDDRFTDADVERVLADLVEPHVREAVEAGEEQETGEIMLTVSEWICHNRQEFYGMLESPN